MAKTHTPAAARKLGLRALILFAIGGLLAAWWIWAVSLGQLAKLIDMAHGTNWRAMVDDQVRGLGFIKQAKAALPEFDYDYWAKYWEDNARRVPEGSAPWLYARGMARSYALKHSPKEQDAFIRREVPLWARVEMARTRFLSSERNLATNRQKLDDLKASNADSRAIERMRDLVAFAAELAVENEKEYAALAAEFEQAKPAQSPAAAEAPGPDRFLPPSLTPSGAVEQNAFATYEARRNALHADLHRAVKEYMKRKAEGESALRVRMAADTVVIVEAALLRVSNEHAEYQKRTTGFVAPAPPLPFEFTTAETIAAAEAAQLVAAVEASKPAPAPPPMATGEAQGPDRFLPPSVAANAGTQSDPPRKPCTFGPGDCPDWEALAKRAQQQGQPPATSAEAERRAANAPQGAAEAAEAPQSAPRPVVGELAGDSLGIAPPFRSAPKSVTGALAGVDVQKVRVWSLLGACVVLALWVLMGGKFAAVRKPAFIPPRFFFLSVPLVGVYAASFLVWPGTMTPTLWPAALAFAPPLVFFVGPVYYVAGFDWIKESAFYRRWLVRGRGFEVARLGGVKAYIQRDITNYSDLNRSGIVRTHYSPLYIGGTLGPLDYKLGGRDIGTVSEQHMVTAAGSGAGKSRDAIFNNLAQYCGGVVAFDTKGELARFAYERRSAYAPFHVIAPWDGTNESDPLGLPLAYWNPLDSIDANSVAARDLIARMCEALIVPDGKDSGNSAHFREMAQMILRGYIAHVKTKYPPEQQHLGTVYDLFKRGAPGESTFDPEKIAQIVLDMADNPACGSTPADAAQAFLMLEDREKSGVVSSITRAVDWMGSPVLKAYFANRSTVNLIDCKTKDASAFLVIPSMYKGTMRGLLRLFYQVAFDQLDEINTRQPAGSGRRVLFLFDEFASLGSFKAAVEAANLKRASFIKCWYIVQNFGQFSALYENPRDFLSNCDKQIFGMDRMDTDTIDIIRKALGSYTDTRGDVHEVKSVMSEGDITETLDGESGEQLFIPMMGAPMVLSRVPYFERLQSWPLRAWGAVKRMMPRPL